MPVKKKRGNKTNKNVEKKEAKKFLEYFHELVDDICTEIMRECDVKCEKINEAYEKELIAMPMEIRNMTLREYLAKQNSEQKQNEENEKLTTTNNAVTSNILKDLKIKSSKIKSQKKKLSIKKRKSRCRKAGSIAVSSLMKNIKSSQHRFMQQKDLTDSLRSKYTPGFSAPITPKFDPSAPSTPGLWRRPKLGEMIMSMSGSPLQNDIDIPSKSECLIFASGKILNLENIENDQISNFDQEAKEQLRNFQAKIAKLLN